MKNKVIIQGYPGSFHDVACGAYFNLHTNQVLPADSFPILAQRLSSDATINYGILAIENSIAGTILQNYKIIRENQFSIIGEIYLRIQHCLMCHKDVEMSDIKEVHSHPMAINQCRKYLSKYQDIKLVNSEDTALSAKLIQDQQSRSIAAIASKRAANIYGLKILQEGIEDNLQNYTRFFIIQREKSLQTAGNKASICIRVADHKGSLLTVMECIRQHHINLSKLQSFPVLGELTEYFFHLDLEFEKVDDYQNCITEIKNLATKVDEFGIYKKADLSAALRKETINVML